MSLVRLPWNCNETDSHPVSERCQTCPQFTECEDARQRYVECLLGTPLSIRALEVGGEFLLSACDSNNESLSMAVGRTFEQTKADLLNMLLQKTFRERKNGSGGKMNGERHLSIVLNASPLDQNHEADDHECNH